MKVLDTQLHSCVYDRKFSQLPDLTEFIPDSVDVSMWGCVWLFHPIVLQFAWLKTQLFHRGFCRTIDPTKGNIHSDFVNVHVGETGVCEVRKKVKSSQFVTRRSNQLQN